MKFISKIDEIREKKNLSTIELAKRAGVSRQAIFKARQDEGIAECRLSTLGHIADALGVKTKRLYDEAEEGEEAQS
jgi:transcriptional regulator with XRE-family HTH domain